MEKNDKIFNQTRSFFINNRKKSIMVKIYLLILTHFFYLLGFNMLLKL